LAPSLSVITETGTRIYRDYYQTQRKNQDRDKDETPARYIVTARSPRRSIA